MVHGEREGRLVDLLDEQLEPVGDLFLQQAEDVELLAIGLQVLEVSREDQLDSISENSSTGATTGGICFA